MTTSWEAQVIGINYYPSYTELSNLTAAANDAEAIATQLETYGYETFRVQRLPRQPNQKGEWQIHPEGGVTRKELREAISHIFQPPAENTPEMALFYFSGHGWPKTVNGREEVFLATSDVFPDEGVYGITLRGLGKIIQESKVKKVVVWLDCCYSGELIKYIPDNKDYCFITATRSYEPGIEVKHEGGLFTKTLLEGLNPYEHPDGIVDSHKLAKLVQERMAQTGQAPQVANSQRSIILTSKFPQKAFKDECPYRSLSYFKENLKDAQVFYGRSKLTQDLVEQVRAKKRLIAVFGASGSGKSSLLRAGLLYQLKLGQLIPGSNNWTYIEPLTPTDKPLMRLREVLAKIDPPLTPPSEGGEQETETNLAPLFKGGWGDQNIILIIDQFEECFTLGDENKRRGFINCLIDLSNNTPNLQIIMGMRSDFRGRLREFPDFSQKMTKINVGHLNREEIREVIEKPADFVGLGIEGELKQKLINDVEDYPGSLPLLQYTLTALWDEARKQGEQFLRLETYQKLGGIEGTLEKRAEQVYESLGLTRQLPLINLLHKSGSLRSPKGLDVLTFLFLLDYQKVAKRIFLELTQVGDALDTRRRVNLGDLVNSHYSLEILDTVTQKLANKDNRLITRTEIDEEISQVSENSPESEIRSSLTLKRGENAKSKIQVDVVHEALIVNWKRLGDWKQKYQDGMVIERRIEELAQDWEKGGRKNEELYPGSKLGIVEGYLKDFGEWGMLDGIAEEFIDASVEWQERVEQEKKARRKREIRNAGGIVAVLVVAVVFTSVLGWKARNAGNEALFNQAEAGGRYSLSLFDQHQDLDAIVEAIRAEKILQKLNKTNPEVRSALTNVLYNRSQRNLLEGHYDDVYSVSISPDGKTLASGSWDGTIKLWNVETGKEIRTIPGHDKEVLSVSFSPDGNTLASGSKDKTIKLWNVKTGEYIRPLTGHKDSVWSVIFSPDRKTLASGSGYEDRTIKIWDVETGKVIHTLKNPKEYCTITDSVNVCTSSPPKNKKPAPICCRYNSVRFSPNGKILAAGSQNNTIELWDIDQAKLIRTLKGHKNEVWSVSFSSDGKTLASGSADSTIKLWNVETGKEIETHMSDRTTGKASTSPTSRTYMKHNDYVYSVSFSPDGKTLASGSRDNTIKLWKVETGEEIRTLKGHTDRVRSISFIDNKTLASGSQDSTIILWNLETGEEIPTLREHTDRVRSISFIDDKTLASGSQDGTIILWDRKKGKKVGIFYHPEKWEMCTDCRPDNYVNSISVSSDGKTLASGGGDGIIKLWDVEKGKEIHTLTGHGKAVRSVSFSPDGNILASGGDDNTIKLWNIKTRKEIHTLTGHGKAVNSVSFSPDGKTLASGSTDGTIKLWDVEKRTEIDTLKGHKSLVWSVSFSPDGKTLASGSHDKTIRLWNVETGEVIKTLTGHNSAVRSVSFSPDGEILASGSSDKTIKLWNVKTREEIITLKGHDDNEVYSVSFSPDGKTLASGSQDSTIKLWNLNLLELDSLKLDSLMRRSCDWVRGYLENHLNATESDRHLCDVKPSKPNTNNG